MSKLRPRLTYANVVSTICLFIVLGGSAVAATVITGKNVKDSSLTGRDVRNSSLTGGDVKNSSLTGADLRSGSVNTDDVQDGSLLGQDFAPGQLPAGLQGPKGEKGDKGDKGDTGDQGDPGPFPGTLPSGKTISGAFHIRAPNSSTAIFGIDISYGFTLASEPTPHYVKIGDPPLAACPGSDSNPQAQAGHLCMYEAHASNLNTTRCIFRTETSTSCATAGKTGAGLQIQANAAGEINLFGTWAVTSP